MNFTEIESLASKLKLFGIQENIQMRCVQGLVDNASYEQVLKNLLEDEKLWRDNSKSRALEKKAAFRTLATIEGWDSSFERGLSKARLRDLSLLSFWKDKKNLLIFGKTGEGKTQLSIALGRCACQIGISVLFISVNLMFEEALAARSNGKFLTWVRKIKKYDVIVMDDFALRSYSHNEAILLVDLLEDRYRKQVHIITSQVDVVGWLNLFEDRVIAEAIVDRLSNPSERVVLGGGVPCLRGGKAPSFA